MDPLEWQMCLDAAQARGWQITQILNTDEHEDHTGGNAPLKAATGAKVLAHAGAASRIGGVDRGLNKGDTVRVGRTVTLECLDTPGHTMTHVCLLSHTEEPALFCGDTLFNAGVGNCHNGGDPATLYETFAAQLVRLPDGTRVYPGHEYMARNLEFTLDREPSNQEAVACARRGARLPADHRAGHHARPGEARQHLPPAAEPGCHRAPAREVPGARRAPDPEDRVHEAARAAQQVVGGACAPEAGRSC